MLARIMAGSGRTALHQLPRRPAMTPAQSASLYPSQVAFLQDALDEAYPTPAAPGPAGVDWRDYGPQQIVELVPPPDLRQRLEVLPQSYLAERKVARHFKLVTSKARGKALLADALTDDSDSSWPEAHYLGPLHPVIDWAADRAMASLGRNQVFAARGDVDHPTVLLLGTLTNRRGQVVASSYLTAEFPNPANPGFCIVTPYESATAMTDSVGYADTASNPGAVAGAEELQPLVAQAARSAAAEMAATFAAAQDAITDRVDRVVPPGRGLDRRGGRARPALRAAPAPRQRPGGAGHRGPHACPSGSSSGRCSSWCHGTIRSQVRSSSQSHRRGGVSHGRERRPDRRRGLDQRALLHHRREVRVVPGQGDRAAQGLGRGRRGTARRPSAHGSSAPAAS